MKFCSYLVQLIFWRLWADKTEADVIFEKTNIRLAELEIWYLLLETAKLIRGEKILGSFNRVANLVRLSIKTATRLKLEKKGCKFLFDGPIYGASGQGNTVFQYAFHGSTVYFAKIETRSTLRMEHTALANLHRDGGVFFPRLRNKSHSKILVILGLLTVALW